MRYVKDVCHDAGEIALLLLAMLGICVAYDIIKVSYMAAKVAAIAVGS